jgi:hypothetical protein
MDKKVSLHWGPRSQKDKITDKLHLTAQNLGQDFNFRNDCVHAVNFLCYRVKLPNLKLKTRDKQLPGALPYDIGLPA